jgi:uncharacterized membrane protein
MAMQEMSDPGEEGRLAERVARLEEQVGELRAELLAARARPAMAPVPPPPVARPPAVARLTWTDPPAGPAAIAAGAQGVGSRVEKESLESRFGAQVLSKVGVVLLLLGAAWFLKWAFENEWIGPLGRVLAWLEAGAGIVVWSERFRRKGYAPFSYALKAVGSGVLYLSLWAGFQLYHLMPTPVALLAMIAVTAWNAWMAWAQDAELLAGYALLGAYLTPALLSTGGDHEIFLFSYLFVIGVSVLAMVREKPWERLLLAALPVTVGYFILWFTVHFTSEKEGLTLGFAVALWAVFAAVPLLAREAEDVVAGVLVPLGAALFGALSVYSVLADSGSKDWEPWAALAFAAVYLALMRVRRGGVAAAIHLTLGIVFLTVAIPLKANGRGITVGWLAEALALLWVSTYLEADRRVHTTLRWLGFGSLMLGVVGAISSPWWAPMGTHAFVNRTFATEMGAVLTLAAAIALGHRMKNEGVRLLEGSSIVASSIVLLNLVVLVAMYREIFRWWMDSAAVDDGAYADFCFSAWMMVQGAAVLAIGFWKRSSFVRWQGLVLLTFTIMKVFAYDMRSLGTGYRVLSYMVLGVLLMAVSFAYQKDWLGLRDDDTDEAEG